MEQTNLFKPFGKPPSQTTFPTAFKINEGGFRDSAASVSADQRWALSQNPVRDPAVPAKNLKSVGG